MAIDIKKENIHSALDIDKTLLVEYSKLLIEVNPKKKWLQGVVNLLSKITEAEGVLIHTHIDNAIICSNINKTCELQKFYSDNKESLVSLKTIVQKDKLIAPLSVNAAIVVSLEAGTENYLKKYSELIEMLSLAISNRSNLIYQEQKELYVKSLLKIERSLSSDKPLDYKLGLISEEILKTLDLSRAQIKFFSPNATTVYDNYLSCETCGDKVLESLSVIPSFEQTYIRKLKSGDISPMDFQLSGVVDDSVSKIEQLLSIKSAFYFPLVFKDKACGILSLHECNYLRKLHEHQKSYLEEVALILGAVFGKETELNDSSVFAPNNKVLTSDELLINLGHLQVQSGIEESPFSLIMVDIQKLNDINLRSGFVAGNLVISQTIRYLSRLYEGLYQIARYNNDEFVVILKGVDDKKVLLEVDRLRDKLKNFSVLGVGPVDYNYSHITYPTHGETIPELLNLLEQSMKLAKTRGKSQVCGGRELIDKSDAKLKELLERNMPEIITKKSNIKTGPEVMETIDKQLNENGIGVYHADILDSVQSLALALDAKDSYTEGHSQRVAEYAYLLAKEIGMELQEQEWVRLAAALHDIGKIGIPENILCKNGKLTNEEYEVMKKHPVIGARILKPIKPLEKVSELVLYHHEYWDGSGYPHGFIKEEIPLGSRIVSIADAYQAMTSDRPYRAGLPQEEAFKRLKFGKEKQWDPELIDTFIKIVS